ncbi:MAG TPA: alpha/beta hydrolase-fold protein [Verrucomicrobiae bacterium]|nr:alpha/beta hydrolase-fold protein [Verrucomicrobiae bacterium]
MIPLSPARMARAWPAILLTCIAPVYASAQTPPATNRPAFTPPPLSPEIHADRTVTFRVRAPKATEASVSGEWPGGTKAMTKDDQGVWSVTLGPLAPELYGYGFTIDGFRTADPMNREVKPMRSPTTSILEVPGNTPLLHEFQDVPHGTVRSHSYHSKSLGRLRHLRVYTPPGYDEGRSRYPVLYLFHGSGDNEGTWTVLGRAHWILDNLIAQKKAKPMIIVMTDGHAASLQTTGMPSPDMISRNVTDFERDLLEDVLPFVEANYRVRKDAASRAIAGLSMGGGQSLTIGLNHAELFGWVGGFSSFVRNPETAAAKALTDPATTNKKLKLLWIACGKDDRLIENARELSGLLKTKNIRHEFLETEGNHSWPVWRRYLADFVPLLFTDTR